MTRRWGLELSNMCDVIYGRPLSLEEVDHLLPLAPNWKSWTSFFNDVANEILSSRDQSVTSSSRDQFVTSQTQVWLQYTYITALRDAIALHFQKGTFQK